jgi:hypothetical protein
MLPTQSNFLFMFSTGSLGHLEAKIRLVFVRVIHKRP